MCKYAQKLKLVAQPCSSRQASTSGILNFSCIWPN